MESVPIPQITHIMVHLPSEVLEESIFIIIVLSRKTHGIQNSFSKSNRTVPESRITEIS